MTTLIFRHFKLNISSISHQQAVAEYWDFSNTDIFQYKDVASGYFIFILNYTLFKKIRSDLEPVGSI
jgi:hypothetical protein